MRSRSSPISDSRGGRTCTEPSHVRDVASRLLDGLDIADIGQLIKYVERHFNTVIYRVITDHDR